MDTLLYILAGASVGLAVGITGVGGGSLMTPLLLLFGFPAHIAIGTDLVYASVTKAGGVILHKRNNTIRMRIVLLMAAGSIPASLVTIYILKNYFTSPEYYTRILTNSLGVMLIITGLVVMLKKKIQESAEKEPGRLQLWATRNAGPMTLITGLFLGFFVTLSSVGAGAFGAAALLLLYPLLPSIHVIGTDLAHAVPLTVIAGIGHIYLGNVDFELLGSLLIGSLPAIYVGTKVGAKMPENIIRPLLAGVLLILGVKYAFF
jgi:uncharacterized membrane protein YfcA